MPFFEYAQSNPGGYFIGPWHYIIVEAASSIEADAIAMQQGVHFGTDRWYSQSYSSGESTPMYYGVELEFRLTELEIVEANARTFANSFQWYDTNILVVYQAAARREWHFTMDLREHAKELDRKTRDYLYGFRVGVGWVSAVHKCFKHDTLDDWYAADGNNFIGGEGWRLQRWGGVTFGCKTRKEAVETQRIVKAVLATADDARKTAIQTAMKADTTLSEDVHKKLLKVLNAAS